MSDADDEEGVMAALHPEGEPHDGADGQNVETQASEGASGADAARAQDSAGLSSAGPRAVVQRAQLVVGGSASPRPAGVVATPAEALRPAPRPASRVGDRGLSGGAGAPPLRRGLRDRVGREALGVAVLALICAALVAAVVVKTRDEAAIAAREAAAYSPPALPSTAPTVGSGSPLIAIVGDESVTAAASGVTAAQGWPRLLATALDVRVTTFAAEGSGYVAQGVKSGDYAASAARVPTDAEVVVFVGGAADAGATSLSVARAATEAIAAASQRAPDAVVVVVGPLFSPDGSTTADVTGLRRTLQSAARIADARWVDPVRSDWVSDARSTADLSAADQRTIATRLAAQIRSEVD